MTTVSLRTDPEVDKAFDVLGVTSGNRSRIMRQAILDAAENKIREQHRADADRLGNDPEDLAEATRIQEDLDDLRAW